MHDPRIGRFFAVDPLTAKYPYYSPYQFSGNRVIDMVELEGAEPKPTDANYNTNLFFGNGVQVNVATVNDRLDELGHFDSNLYNNNWNPYVYSNITQAKQKVQSVAEVGVDIKNVVLTFHGNIGSLYLVSNGSDISSYKQSREIGRITDFEINKYVSLKGDRKATRKFLDGNTQMQAAFKAIEGIESIMSNLSNGGNLIFGGCLAGNGEEGDGLINALYNLAGDNDVNIFLSTGLVQYDNFTILDVNAGTRNWKTKDNSGSIKEVSNLQLKRDGEPVDYE